MIIYEIEKSLNGVCSAIFNAFTKNEVPDVVTAKNEYQVGFTTKIYKIKPDAINADRVKTAIIKYSNEYTLDMIKHALLCADDFACQATFNYIKLMMDLRRDIAFDLAEPAVIEFNEVKDKVWLEVHRFKGFMRFSETDNGVLYAHFAPTHDILELVVGHFKRRYRYHEFVIHDTKRNKVAVYDKSTLKFVNPKDPLTIYVDETELAYRSLFKEYFNAVNIPERKNPRQQKNYMPKRYWSDLTELGGAI